MSEEAQAIPKPPGLFRNYLSFIGAAIAAACLTSIVLLLLLDLTSGTNNPYLGIFTYVLFPSILIFSLFIILAGMLFERRRRRRLDPSETPGYPKFDLNDPRRRRSFFIFLGITFLFICLSAFGSYRAYEFSESVVFCGQTCHSVMNPEFVAYLASPHARVRCVECHVGPGAEGYVNAKFNGVHQLYAVTFRTYPKPITTPVHNMPAVEGTCEKCHWPEKFYGDELKVFDHYGYDEKNTPRRTRMLIKVGGGSSAVGPVTGIHWHMNLANEVSYIATDAQRQQIPWVRMKDRQGNVVEYLAKNSPLTPDQIEQSPKRRMDCIDCHNRPAHIYASPDEAVDGAFAAGKLDASVPFLKQQSVRVLSQTYNSTEEALNAIANGLNEFYRTNYNHLYERDGGASIRGAVAEVQRIYQRNFFPEMKTDWQSHPNNIGHYYFQGCFRCHDGQHVSGTGQVISSDCNTCHTTLDQSPELSAATSAPGGAFQHPVDLGKLSSLNCTVCHKGDAGFQHPVMLGDLSGFKCVDCHSGKVWSTRSSS